MTALARWVVDASAVLERVGFAPADARQDVAVLARAVLGWDAARWLTHLPDPAPPGFVSAADALVARRAAREPVAYLVGQREFFGRTFFVNRAVLVPRPETELVIEQALAVLRGTPATIIDVGTGSGCLAVTLAAEIPAARVIATDTSQAALDVARENAARLGVVSQIIFRHGALAAGADRPADLIVSNPPYVREDERGTLPPDVVNFEPEGALFAGPDGLDVIRPLVTEAARLLAPGGHLVMEIGAGQADAVAALVRATGRLRWRGAEHDLQGIPRVIVARVL